MNQKFFRLSAIVILLLCISCKEEEQQMDPSLQIRAGNPELLNGDLFQGGILRLNYNYYPESFFPPAVTSAEGKAILNQLYDGLFRIDEAGEIVPHLVESYTITPDKKRYRFKLKKEVYFHDDPAFPQAKGRELIAEDILYVFKQFCTYKPDNQYGELFYPFILGGKNYYNRSRRQEMGEVLPEGIQKLGRFDVSITLNTPDPSFLEKLTRPAAFIYPKEMLTAYKDALDEHAIGTGPFQLRHAAKDITIVAERNPNYHKQDQYGNALPYLDGISYQFIKDRQSELREFLAGKLDGIYNMDNTQSVRLLESERANGKGEFKELRFCVEPNGSNTLVAFMPRKRILRSLNFRKALNFAIDRKKLMLKTINNEGLITNQQSIVPPVQKAYPTEKLQTYDYSLDSALYYLDLAAYQYEQEPALEIAYQEENAEQVRIAKALSHQLLLTGINVKEKGYNQEKWEQIARSGAYDLLLMNFEARSAKEYLYQFYPRRITSLEKDPISLYSYSPSFIEYFRQAQNPDNRTDRLKLLTKAEQALMDQAPAIFLWYGAEHTVIRSYIENFPCGKSAPASLEKVYYRKAISI